MIETPQLRELVRRAAAAPPAEEVEHCDLCSIPIPPDHRHLLDLASGEPQCACQACRLLFDRDQAGGDHYKLIPERRLALDGFVLDDRMWAGLGVPVDLAFFTVASADGAVTARYPSSVGITASRPAPDAWEELESLNPVLAELATDVEALLVNRVRGAREHWLVPIDDCFRLAALVREHWSGFTGGDEVWDEIARFFAELRTSYGREEAR